MKMTLLDMVQSILSSMNSDEVNSISDTVESRQVAQIIKTVYYNILTRADFPEHVKLVNLDPSGDPDMPVLMLRPDNVVRIVWIKYDISDEGDVDKPNYRYVTILPNEQFLQMVHMMNPEESDVSSMSFNDHVYYFKNNSHPTYCTIVQDKYIIFDSYNSSVDTTLQDVKTLCKGTVVPVFSMTDDFIPDLDTNMFPLLLNEAKTLAFLELKQTVHELAAVEARRQWRNVQRIKHTTKRPTDFDSLPNYGRK